ncbi:DUF930 domain-containing protein [Oryzicola mucosus]
MEIVNLPPPISEEKREPVRQLPLSNQRVAAQADSPPDNAATPPVSQAIQPPDKKTPGKVKPTLMLSEKVLADPRSRKARQELAALAPADQIEQLCGLEAMAQVSAWSKEFLPDRVVTYATAEPTFAGNALSADGAALHSKQDWFKLQFKCELTPDHKRVAAFEFLVGDPIPRIDWSEHSLPDEGRSLD